MNKLQKEVEVLRARQLELESENADLHLKLSKLTLNAY
jgi:hypothetical protein